MIKSNAVGDKVTIEMDNGHKKALDSIVQKWNFKDVNSALSFALAVLVQADEPQLKIRSEGKDAVYVPQKEVLKENAE